MGFLKPPKVDLPNPVSPPVPPLAITPDKRPAKKPMAPTFLGTETTPSLVGNTSSTGGKSLLGSA